MAQAYDSKGYDRMMVNGLREYYDALTYENDLPLNTSFFLLLIKNLINEGADESRLREPEYIEELLDKYISILAE
jgi:hypothetical protein